MTPQAIQPRSLRIAQRVTAADGTPRLSVVITARGQDRGYWVTASSEGGEFVIRWEREDGAAVYRVVAQGGHPVRCDCPARGICRHMLASAKLVERGELTAVI